MLSETLIKEFRDIFREDYGLEMAEQEAAKMAAFVVSYFDLLAKAKAEHKDDSETAMKEAVSGS